MIPQADAVPMHMFHEDAVTVLPDGCDLLGSSAQCEIASFAKDAHIFTTQAHPEFSPGFMDCVLRFTQDKMPQPTVKRAWDSLHQTARGDLFALWVTEFFKRAIHAA